MNAQVSTQTNELHYNGGLPLVELITVEHYFLFVNKKEVRENAYLVNIYINTIYI